MSHDFPDRGRSVFIVSVTFHTLATVFVAARTIARVGIVRKFGWDDGMMLVAWMLAFALSFAVCFGTTLGLGRHQGDVPEQWQSALRKTEYVFSVCYNPALMATKTSILMFYLRLYWPVPFFRRSCYATLVAVNVPGFALTMLNILQCRPVSAAFTTPVPDNATCQNLITLYLSSAPVNIITDLAVILLPIPTLTGLSIPTKTKSILLATFGAGVFVTIVDIVRIAYLQDAATARLLSLQDGGASASNGQRDNTDITWYASYSYMWSAVEVNVGIMCGCVPMLKPLVVRLVPSLLRDLDIRKYSTGSAHRRMSTKHTNRSGRLHSDRHPSIPHSAVRSIHIKESIETVDEVYLAHKAEGGQNGTGNIIRMNSISIHDARGTEDDEIHPEKPKTFFVETTIQAEPKQRQASTFDFVKPQSQAKKSLIQLTAAESLRPIIMVTIVFFIWGISYGFLATLNAQFQRAARMTAGQSIGIHSAYYGGYLVAPLTFGRLCLKRLGFKACFVVGLLIYAGGVLIFWPSAVLTNFPAFLVTNFLVGMGVSTLEIAANPFIALCGPQQYMEMRLLLSQGVQAVGTVISQLVSDRALFKSSAISASSLVNAQWTYLGLAFFSVLLAVLFYYLPLPDVSDEQLEQAQTEDATEYANQKSILGMRVIWVGLGLGVLSQWCYVGAQEAVSTAFPAYEAQTFGRTSLNLSDWQALQHASFAIGRFTAAGANWFLKSRHLLLFFYIAAVVFSAIAMSVAGVVPRVVLVLLFFFEGPIFPLVFASCLRGMGKHTKRAAVLLTAAICGGSCWPPLMYAAIKNGDSTQRSFFVVLIAFALGSLLPIWQNLQPVAKKVADPVHKEEDEFAILGVLPHISSSSSR